VSSPAIALCRLLLDRGHAPDIRLELYRGTTLALIIRSIGEAAELEVAGSGFHRRAAPRTASPVSAKPDGQAEIPIGSEPCSTASGEEVEEEREDREASKHRTSSPPKARRRSAA
jgi:hypothetical protein